jgi:hypothetical protein
MDQRFFYIAPYTDQLASDQRRQLARERERRMSQQTASEHERWPTWVAGAPDVPAYPWERPHVPVAVCQTGQAQPRRATLLTRALAGLRLAHSR